MELDIKPTIRKSLVKTEHFGGDTIINLYKTPPYGQLSMEECEDLFRQRLEAYEIVEKSDMSPKNIVDLLHSFREIKSYVYKTNCIIVKANDKQQQRLDHFSHMLARMYCVYHPNHWIWFKTCERKLFYYRLKDQASMLSGGQLESILNSFNFDFTRVIGAELSELERANIVGWDKSVNKTNDIFKVKFEHALKFVAKRSVSLDDGFAYLTKHEIISVVCDVFEKHLETELYYARQHLNTDLPQTQQLLESMHLVYLDYQEKLAEQRKIATKNRGDESNFPYRIDIDNLDEIVKNHYPPCMRHIHEALMQDQHLKHQGRLHYGAFLRSGGVELDTAIEFWRKEFTKKIANDKFERHYKYNIRHLYGKEGHKKALSSFSCDKIINDCPPGPSEKHGCPFKHFDEAHLKPLLIKHGLKDVDINSVLIQRNNKEYRQACTHYFKARKGDFPTETIKNPIHYYLESRRFEHRPLQIEAPLDPMPEQIPNITLNANANDEDMEEWDDE